MIPADSRHEAVTGSDTRAFGGSSSERLRRERGRARPLPDLGQRRHRRDGSMARSVRVVIGTCSRVVTAAVRCDAGCIAVAAHAFGAGNASADEGGPNQWAGRGGCIPCATALCSRSSTRALGDLILRKRGQLRSTQTRARVDGRADRLSRGMGRRCGTFVRSSYACDELRSPKAVPRCRVVR